MAGQCAGHLAGVVDLREASLLAALQWPLAEVHAQFPVGGGQLFQKGLVLLLVLRADGAQREAAAIGRREGPLREADGSGGTPSLIALIEAIVYVTMTDEAFAELAGQAARREALVRAFRASGQEVEAFADMYGL